MFENAKNSKQKGSVGIGSAISYFTEQCWIVSIPLNDSQEYDLIIDDGSGPKRVQVKTTDYKVSDSYCVGLRTCGGNQSYHTAKHFDHSKVDYLFILTSENQKFLIPVDKFSAKSELKLGKKYQEFLVD